MALQTAATKRQIANGEINRLVAFAAPTPATNPPTPTRTGRTPSPPRRAQWLTCGPPLRMSQDVPQPSLCVR